MVILGLTGSIGMGKTAAARALRRCGAAVFDADAEVHRLIGPGGAAVAAVEAAFPGCVVEGRGGRRVDRDALAERVFGDADATARLEAVLHPRVREAEDRFLRRAAAAGRQLVVLDVPLMFETGGDRRCDAVAVVTAPAFVQAHRALRRPGMTPERLAAIRSRQMPDHEKRRRADFIILSGLDRWVSLRAVWHIVTMLAGRRGRKWPPRPQPRIYPRRNTGL